MASNNEVDLESIVEVKNRDGLNKHHSRNSIHSYEGENPLAISENINDNKVNSENDKEKKLEDELYNHLLKSDIKTRKIK